MFAHQKSIPSDSPPTARDIAASITKPAALVLAERNLMTLRKTRDETDAEREALYRLPAHLTTRRIWEINVRKKAVDTEVSSARQHVATLRAKHETAVRGALAPLRAGAIAQFNEAYAALLAGWRTLDEIEAAASNALAQGDRTRMKAGQFDLVVRAWITKVAV